MRRTWVALAVAASAVMTIACRVEPPADPAGGASGAGGGEAGEFTGDDPEDPSDALPQVAPPAAPAASPRAALLGEAHRELDAVRESHYAHRTRVVEAEGVFDYDCSGFVGYALTRAAPAALQPVVDATRRRPLARDFVAFLGAPSAPWTRVERVGDLVPGDVIAWLEPPAKHSRNTGHMMIVDRAPHVGNRPGELVVGVIDSSHSGHGMADTRAHDRKSGLGAGEIVLVIDGDGRPTGFRWSRARRSAAFSTQIALGHLP